MTPPKVFIFRKIKIILKDFKKEFVDNSTLNPQRFLTALDLYAHEYLIDASRKYWLKAWSRHETFFGIDTIEEVFN